MKKLELRSKRQASTIAFYLGYVVLLASIMFAHVNIPPAITSWAYRVALAILAIICALNLFKMPRKQIAVAIAAVILALITKFTSGSNTILVLVLAVIACRNIKLEDVIRFDLKFKILFLIIVSCLYFAGLTGVNLHYRDGILRHSMGFSNPNVFSSFLLSIVLEILYLRKDKINLLDFGIIAGAIFLISYFTGSRMHIICLAIISLALIALKIKNRRKSKRPKKHFLISHIFTICALLSLVLVAGYSNGSEMAHYINSQSSKRISNAAMLMNRYDVNLFGQELPLVSTYQAQLSGERSLNLDNVYIYMLLSYGVFNTIAMCVFMNKYMNHAMSKNKSMLIIIMTIFAITGLAERIFLEVHFDIFLLYFSYMLYGEPKQQAKSLEAPHA